MDSSHTSTPGGCITHPIPCAMCQHKCQNLFELSQHLSGVHGASMVIPPSMLVQVPSIVSQPGNVITHSEQVNTTGQSSDMHGQVSSNTQPSQVKVSPGNVQPANNLQPLLPQVETTCNTTLVLQKPPSLNYMELNNKCRYCHKYFATKDELANHRKTQHGIEHVCSVCSKTFKAKSHLEIHMTVHSDTRKFKCLECDKCYKTNSALYNHQKAKGHQPKFQGQILRPKVCLCDECGASFSSRHLLQSHRKKYFEQGLPCGSSMDGNDLGKYVGKISEEVGPNVISNNVKNVIENGGCSNDSAKEKRPTIICALCGEYFIDQSTLNEHKRNIHSIIANSRNPVYKCPACEKIFSVKVDLKSHLNAKRKGKKCPGSVAARIYAEQPIAIQPNNLRLLKLLQSNQH